MAGAAANRQLAGRLGFGAPAAVRSLPNCQIDGVLVDGVTCSKRSVYSDFAGIHSLGLSVFVAFGEVARRRDRFAHHQPLEIEEAARQPRQWLFDEVERLEFEGDGG